jgi:hypothetical protein
MLSPQLHDEHMDKLFDITQQRLKQSGEPYDIPVSEMRLLIRCADGYRHLLNLFLNHVIN